MFVRELFFAYESILCVITVNIKENLNTSTTSRPNNEHLTYFYIQFDVRYYVDTPGSNLNGKFEESFWPGKETKPIRFSAVLCTRRFCISSE